jgi:hypothetical protein
MNSYFEATLSWREPVWKSLIRVEMRIPHDRTDRPDGALTGHPAALCGLRVVPGYLDREAQEFVLAAVREVIARAPLYTPRMPKSGKPMSVRMTNCGTLGWMTDERGYRYQPTHPETGAPWPPIPGCLLRAWTELGGYPLPPQACLVNVYGVETSFDADHGWHPGPGEPEGGRPAGQSQLPVIRARRQPIRRERRQHLQFEQRQCRGNVVHLL